MIIATKKWIFLKISGALLIPLMLWFIFNLITIYDQGYNEVTIFFTKSLSKFLFSLFIILGFTWSFLFQILSEIRHLFMDIGYGFEIKTSNITGLIVIFGSIIFTVIFYLIGKNFIL